MSCVLVLLMVIIVVVLLPFGMPLPLLLYPATSPRALGPRVCTRKP
jgi:hypothetical protein